MEFYHNIFMCARVCVYARMSVWMVCFRATLVRLMVGVGSGIDAAAGDGGADYFGRDGGWKDEAIRLASEGAVETTWREAVIRRARAPPPRE